MLLIMSHCVKKGSKRCSNLKLHKPSKFLEQDEELNAEDGPKEPPALENGRTGAVSRLKHIIEPLVKSYCNSF